MTGPHPAISRRVLAAKLPKGGQHVRIEADAAALIAVAAQLGLPRVESVSAKLELTPVKSGLYAVAGEVKARVWQTCVVTLDDFATDIAAPIDATFADGERLPQASKKEVERSLEDEDPPEPLDDGCIDAGALAVEFLALALEPFPRKPGAELPDGVDDAPEASPFAALAALRVKK
jgi:hypothetical protein